MTRVCFRVKCCSLKPRAATALIALLVGSPCRCWPPLKLTGQASAMRTGRTNTPYGPSAGAEITKLDIAEIAPLEIHTVLFNLDQTAFTPLLYCFSYEVA